VIPTHANEVATVGGVLQPGTRTAAFADLVKAKVSLPISDRTMEFDAGGRCRSNC
jgi:hypothetical protein